MQIRASFLRMRIVLRLLLLSSLFACGVDHEKAPDDPTPPDDPNVGTDSVPDIRCEGPPVVGAATGFRHTSSEYIAQSGSPHHRGIDLIASTNDATQTITGKVTYGATDKDLQDEDIELFACLPGGWVPIGTARTNTDGRFELALSGDQRLPAGMRDLYLSVAGDRTDAAFIGFVAPPTTRLVVSDVDGTLTESENAYPAALASGGQVAMQPSAADALLSVARRNFSVVYITARGDRFSQDTRQWFRSNGFPRGPLRMPVSLLTVPGEDTIEFKTTALASLDVFETVAGVGNRASDITAYTNAGVAKDHIFIKLPEFEEEVAARLAASEAIGFQHYDDLRTQYFVGL
jgi:phosphatidate phosphatase PAH1